MTMLWLPAAMAEEEEEEAIAKVVVAMMLARMRKGVMAAAVWGGGRGGRGGRWRREVADLRRRFGRHTHFRHLALGGPTPAKLGGTGAGQLVIAIFPRSQVGTMYSCCRIDSILSSIIYHHYSLIYSL
jgi:hypothetical protein